jgi:phenylpyruvate tautomerase PptA (4-oxalocrotonate tautomerase family)
LPLLKITTSTRPSPASEKFLASLSSLVAELLGKPESYVMTAIEHPAVMTFGGTTEPTCYVELKNVGRFRPELTKHIAAVLCEQLSAGLGVPKARIYIEFGDVDGYLWGHNGETFG